MAQETMLEIDDVEHKKAKPRQRSRWIALAMGTLQRINLWGSGEFPADPKRRSLVDFFADELMSDYAPFRSRKKKRDKNHEQNQKHQLFCNQQIYPQYPSAVLDPLRTSALSERS